MKAKVILVPVSKAQLSSHIGHILYRTSGPVKIIDVKQRAIEYEFVGQEGVQQNYEGKGFFKPVFVIVDRTWEDQDDLFYEVLPSQYWDMLSYIPELRTDLYAIGWNPIVSSIINIEIYEPPTNFGAGIGRIKVEAVRSKRFTR